MVPVHVLDSYRLPWFTPSLAAAGVNTRLVTCPHGHNESCAHASPPKGKSQAWALGGQCVWGADPPS